MKFKSIVRSICAAAAVMVFGLTAAFHSYAVEILDEVPDNAELLDDGLLDKATICIHPAGQSSHLSVKSSGRGLTQNVVHLYNIGDASRFWLTKADDESYYIDFFPGTNYTSPSDKRLDLSDKGDDGYFESGNVVHVVNYDDDEKIAENKRWMFYRNPDGTYYIRNKYSKLYWDLEDNDFDDGNKLCQRSLAKAQKWEIEIVDADGSHEINELKDYDSYTFKYNGENVTGINWMSHLPDDMLLSDITMPGVHDAATAHTNFEVNSSAQCQQHSIESLLNCGVRYFDMRMGKHVGVPNITMVHGPVAYCVLPNGSPLTWGTVENWIERFLMANPRETVVLQLKIDRGDQDFKDLVYDYFQNRVNNRPYLFFVGDYIPTLGECRGKMVILSRLEDQTDEDFKSNSGGQWALDVHDWGAWTGDKNDPLKLTKSTDDFEIWTEDIHTQIKDNKWTIVQHAIFDHETGAEAKRAAIREKNKDGWIISYTSCTHMAAPVHYPQPAARFINPKLKNKLRTDADVLQGQYLGVVCSDFSDQQLTYLVYKQNFISGKAQVTIKGVDKAGDQTIIDPLVLDVDKNKTLDQTLGLEAVQKQIDEWFSTDNYYRPYGYDQRDKIEQLRRIPMNEIAGPEEYAANAVHLEKLYPSDAPVLYVALDVVKSPGSSVMNHYSIELEAPPCNTVISGADGDDWSGQTPRPEFKIRSTTTQSHIAEDNGVPRAWWVGTDGKPYNGPANSETIRAALELEMDWGYCLTGSHALWIFNCNGKESTRIPGTRKDSKHLIFSTVNVYISHKLQHVDEVNATCTADGMKEHYYCTDCGGYFSDNKAFPTEVSEDTLKIAALGHDWGEWTTEGAPAGQEVRVCARDGNHKEYRTSGGAAHPHALTQVPAKAAGCVEDGNIEYWVCSEAGCGKYFSDAGGKTETTKEAVIIPATGHHWGEPEYIWADDYSTVTAKRTCLHDHTHVESETAEASDSGKPATCEEAGTKKLHAEFTNGAFTAQDKEVDVPALGHDWDEGRVTKEASCTEEGIRTYTCKHDETHTREEIIAAKGHTTATRVKEGSDTATCDQGGSRMVETYCTVCGVVLSESEEVSPALGHDWGQPTYTWSEDLTQVTAERICERNSSHVETETKAAELVTTQAASCEEAGYDRWSSEEFEHVAFEIQERLVEIPALGHDWGEWTVTKEATADEEGEETRVCKRDPSHIETRVIPALTTTFTVSFDANGGTGTMEDVTGVSGKFKLPTCLFNAPEGKTFACWTVEDQEYNEGDTFTVRADTTVTASWKEVPEHDHRLTLMTAVEAACTEDGHKAYYTCSECDQWFEDALGLVPITDKSSFILKALGHQWGEWTVTKEATVSEEGEETRSCTRCRETETRSIPKKDAEPGDDPGVNPGDKPGDEPGVKPGDKPGDKPGEKSATVTFTVHFNNNGHGTKPADQTIESGKTAAEPVLTQSGYIFRGWYSDASCRHRFSFDTPITSDITLYARWTRRSSDGGSSNGGSSYTPGGSYATAGGSGIPGSSTPAYGRWSKEDDGWHYYENGKPAVNGWRNLPYNGVMYWYYFNQDGVMQVDWLDWNGSRYYLYPVSDGWMGRMLTGWQMIDGKWYYFETIDGRNKGRMYRSERTPDGYYVGADGVWTGGAAGSGR